MLPSLSSSRPLRFFAFTAFYVAQGIPIGLLTVAMPAWLAASGAAAGEVATFVAVSTLPWGFKLLAGPVMDRFKFPSMGGRRPWVMAAQSGLLLSLVGLALAGGEASDVLFLTWAGFTINSFAAVQDVAVDGMAIDVLREEERGRANALMAFGQVAGYAGSGALCGWALSAVGLGTTAALMAVLVAVILAIVVALRERDGEKLLPWTAGSVQHEDHLVRTSFASLGGNLLRLLLMPTSLLLIAAVLCWRLSDGIFITAVPVLVVQELGWTSAQYSAWYSNSSLVAAVFGIAVGPLVDRHGATRYLGLGLLGCTLVYAALWLSSPLWSEYPIWVVGLFAANMMIQVVFVAMIALSMAICWPRIAATQFAVLMAWSNLSRSIGAQTYGGLSEHLQLGQECLVMAVVSLVGAGLVLFVNLDRHRQRLAALQARQPELQLEDVPARF
jgi:PAT family beta-lactamase induction signal transducer AmpG